MKTFEELFAELKAKADSKDPASSTVAELAKGKHFIGKNIRLSPVVLNSDTNVQQLLNYYMGGNTPERQSFIMKHLKVEEDLVRDA